MFNVEDAGNYMAIDYDLYNDDAARAHLEPVHTKYNSVRINLPTNYNMQQLFSSQFLKKLLRNFFICQ